MWSKLNVSNVFLKRGGGKVLQFLAGFLVFPPGGRSFLSLCSLWWSWSSRRDMLEYVGMVQDSEFNKGPQGENKGLKKGLYGWRVMNGKIWRTTPTEYTVMRFTGVVWPLLLSWTLALIVFFSWDDSTNVGAVNVQLPWRDLGMNFFLQILLVFCMPCTGHEVSLFVKDQLPKIMLLVRCAERAETHDGLRWYTY